MRILFGFIAGFLATLIFHQVGLALFVVGRRSAIWAGFLW